MKAVRLHGQKDIRFEEIEERECAKDQVKAGSGYDPNLRKSRLTL